MNAAPDAELAYDLAVACCSETFHVRRTLDLARRVDIMNGSAVVRTLAATSPSSVYTAAQQAVDFGSAQPSVSVRRGAVSRL